MGWRTYFVSLSFSPLLPAGAPLLFPILFFVLSLVGRRWTFFLGLKSSSSLFRVRVLNFFYALPLPPPPLDSNTSPLSFSLPGCVSLAEFFFFFPPPSPIAQTSPRPSPPLANRTGGKKLRFFSFIKVPLSPLFFFLPPRHVISCRIAVPPPPPL